MPSYRRQLDRLHATQVRIDTLRLDQHRIAVELYESGCPWSTIGRALGITKQAAQQRFSGPAPGRLL
jgi:hypothetical protein